MEVKLSLTKRQLVLMTAILGSSQADELYEVYEELYMKLDQIGVELTDELSQYIINVNTDESQLLDDIVEEYLKRGLGR